MKKLYLFIIFYFTLCICFAQNFNKQIVGHFEFHPNDSFQSEKMFGVYDIQIHLKNVSYSPVFFWSWYNRWFSNFRFANNNAHFINRFVSDAPICCLIMPGLTVEFDGQINFSNINLRYLFDNKEISFLYYDALKYSKEDYLRKDYISTNILKRKLNEFKIIADTIKLQKTEIFQLW